MGNLSSKNYQAYIELCLLIIGVLILLFFSNSLKYAGIAFIAVAVGGFIFSFFYKPNNERNEGNFRSRTRDQIFKYQNKMK